MQLSAYTFVISCSELPQNVSFTVIYLLSRKKDSFLKQLSVFNFDIFCSFSGVVEEAKSWTCFSLKQEKYERGLCYYDTIYVTMLCDDNTDSYFSQL